MMRVVLISGLVLLLAGCGVSDLTIDESEQLDQLSGGLVGGNGRLANGRLSNGRLANGRLANGRLANGFSVSGYGGGTGGGTGGGVGGGTGGGGGGGGSTRDAAFDTWWNADPAGANMEMTYVVRCAAPAGSTVRYVATNGSSYKWIGMLGLAPGWFNKSRTTVDPGTLTSEQERVSACLLGLSNAQGTSVNVSAGGLDIPRAPSEYTEYPVEEGAFFGNLFIDVPTRLSCMRLRNTACGDIYTSCSMAHGRTCAANPSTCGMTAVGYCMYTCRGTEARTECLYNGRWYPAFNVSVQGYSGDGYCERSECPTKTSDCQAADYGSTGVCAGYTKIY